VSFSTPTAAATAVGLALAAAAPTTGCSLRYSSCMQVDGFLGGCIHAAAQQQLVGQVSGHSVSSIMSCNMGAFLGFQSYVLLRISFCAGVLWTPAMCCRCVARQAASCAAQSNRQRSRCCCTTAAAPINRHAASCTQRALSTATRKLQAAGLGIAVLH
jgi:hypothetical protein